MSGLDRQHPLQTSRSAGKFGGEADATRVSLGAPIRHTTSRFSLDNATAPSLGGLQEPCMSKPFKRADPLAQQNAPSDAGRAEKDAARLGRDTRGWVAANKRSGKEFEARRNLPSGPLGGSGRKTNISRSS